MVTEQQNLIYMLNTNPLDQQMVNATKQKLSLLGMNAQQIAEVERTKVAKKIFTVYSPYSGYLVGNESNTSQTTNKGSAMGEGGSSSQTAQNLSFREGAYIEKGQTIFSMANNRKVWAILKIYEKDIQLISPNLKVEIVTEDPQAPIYKAQVDFIEPFNGTNSKMFNVRVYLNNENQKLKIGQLVNGSITAKTQAGLWIPKTAVIDLGMSKVVFMKENQIFHAMPIVTGASIDQWIQVVSGIDENTEIASDAHYLIDSESFIPHKKHGM
jgi:Cu(I)/Ag(I) efflux system membrane fusion protein